jgi:hypothetical protein
MEMKRELSATAVLSIILQHFVPRRDHFRLQLSKGKVRRCALAKVGYAYLPAGHCGRRFRLAASSTGTASHLFTNTKAPCKHSKSHVLKMKVCRRGRPTKLREQVYSIFFFRLINSPACFCKAANYTYKLIQGSL